MDFTAYPFEIKALSESGQIEGLAAGYGNLDNGGDIVEPGAFTASLAAHKVAGTMPAMLLYHDPRRPAGRWDAFEESSAGLVAKGQLSLAAGDGREAYALLKDKALTGLSIGYRAEKEARGKQSGSRLIQQAKLFEVSLVSVPMNERTRITGVKSLATIQDIENLFRDSGLSGRKAKRAASAAWAAIDGKFDDDPTEQKLAELLNDATAGLARYLETK